MRATMIRHPEYNRWHDIVKRMRSRSTACRGTLFRATDPPYANERDLLTGEGAKKSGGRWNAPGSFPLVYLSQTIEAAIAETIGLSAHYGFDPAARLPLTLVAVDASLESVLDLTDSAVRKTLGVTLAALNACAWKAENAAGREAITQAVGRAAWAAGFVGIVVPTPLSRSFRHLDVFPQNLGKSGVLRIRGADKLLPPPGPGIV